MIEDLTLCSHDLLCVFLFQLIKYFLNTFIKTISDIKLPQSDYLPSVLFQPSTNFFITFAITSNFSYPIINVRLRHDTTRRMPMQKVLINKDSNSLSSKNNIGFPDYGINVTCKINFPSFQLSHNSQFRACTL